MFEKVQYKNFSNENETKENLLQFDEFKSIFCSFLSNSSHFKRDRAESFLTSRKVQQDFSQLKANVTFHQANCYATSNEFIHQPLSLTDHQLNLRRWLFSIASNHLCPTSVLMQTQRCRSKSVAFTSPHCVLLKAID